MPIKFTIKIKRTLEATGYQNNIGKQQQDTAA